MNNQEVLQIAKDCGLIYNNNHDILEFYQKIRSQVKKEFTVLEQQPSSK